MANARNDAHCAAEAVFVSTANERINRATNANEEKKKGMQNITPPQRESQESQQYADGDTLANHDKPRAGAGWASGG